MSEYLFFNYRQLDPNITEGINFEIPDSPPAYLVASLKGGAAIRVTGPNDVVKLSAVVGWVSGASNSTIEFSIYRGARSNDGGTLIFSTQDSVDPTGEVLRTTSFVTVDVPQTTGIVNYFLEAIMNDGDGFLTGPSTFIGEVILP